MKKWFASIMIVLLAAFALAGCSSGKTAKGTWNTFVSTFNKAAEASPQDIAPVASLFYTSGSSLYNSFVDASGDAYFGGVTHLKTTSFKLDISNTYYAKATIAVKRTVDGFVADDEFTVYFYVNQTTGKWLFCTPVTVTDEAGLGNSANKSFYNGVVQTTTIVDADAGNYDVNYRRVYADTTNFVASDANDTITYITPVKNKKNQVIPEEIDNCKVTAIANFAFYKVTKILNTTFSASKMTSVDIPSTVTSIGEDAFYQCRKLKELDIPSSVKTVGEYGIASCTGLTSMTIHADDVTNYGSLAAGVASGSLKITGATDSYVGDVLALSASYRNEDVTSRVYWTTSATQVTVGAYSGLVTCTQATSDNTTVKITGTLLNTDGSLSTTSGTVTFAIGTVKATMTFGNHSLDRLSSLKTLYLDAINPNSLIFYSGLALPKTCVIYVPAKNITTWKTSTYFSAYANQIQAWPQE